MRAARLISLDVPDAGLVHVAIVAHDPLARMGLAALLADQPGYIVVDTGAADDEMADAYPDVVLWDTGPGLTPFIEPDLFYESALPIVALVSDPSLVEEAWQAGARGLLLREADPSSLAAALMAVMQDLVVIDPALVDTVLALRETMPAAEDLTSREAEVLSLIAEGLPNKLIADRLDISEHTVKFHVGSIFSKLGVHSRTEAVIRAARLGVLII
jgi:DNA-binding NarL/FixJ family response regulator